MTARNLVVEPGGNGIDTYMVNGFTVDNVRITRLSCRRGRRLRGPERQDYPRLLRGFPPLPGAPRLRTTRQPRMTPRAPYCQAVKSENVEVGYVHGSGIMNAVTVFDDHHLVGGQPNGADNVYFHDVDFSTIQPNCIALRGVTHGRLENITCHTLPSARVGRRRCDPQLTRRDPEARGYRGGTLVARPQLCGS